MPIIKSAKKAARQADKRTEHNKQIKKDIKTALKAFKANPSKETWDTRTECDAKLCGVMTEVGYYLKSIK